MLQQEMGWVVQQYCTRSSSTWFLHALWKLQHVCSTLVPALVR